MSEEKKYYGIKEEQQIDHEAAMEEADNTQNP